MDSLILLYLIFLLRIKKFIKVSGLIVFEVIDMYEKTVYGFAQDAVKYRDGNGDFRVEREVLMTIYNMAKYMNVKKESSIYDSDVVNGISFVEVFEKFIFDDEEETFILFDVLYSGKDGIVGISAVVGNKFNEGLAGIFVI